MSLSTNSKIYVAGHNGMVGSAIIKHLKKKNFNHIVTRSHGELDLTEQVEVRKFFRVEKPDYVVIAAAKVGGINANNSFPAEFIYQNLVIESNVINESFQVGVRQLLFLGSSCIYPKFSQQPIKEEYLLTGELESTNEPYAIAKIAGIKLCESYNRQYGTQYRSAMPTNLYGPNDNFSLQESHVIPALLRKFHEAKVSNHPHVEVWGTGKPFREFLHVDDMADACTHIMLLDDSIYEQYTQPMLSHINVGAGNDVSIAELAEMIKVVTEYDGSIIYNTDMPDGTKKKLLDVSRLKNMGWSAKILLKDGLTNTYQWFLNNINEIRK